MQISITPAEVELALEKIEPGLNQYLAVIAFTTGHTRWYDNPDFRRQFNAFYRVRRHKETWQPAFYEVFGEATATPHSFKDILVAYSTRWRTRFHADGGQCSSVIADSIPR